MTSASPYSIRRAASPRLPQSVGGAQTYVGYFYGQNATASADAARLRPMVDLFNATNINGAGTGSDEVQILGVKVEEIQRP